MDSHQTKSDPANSFVKFFRLNSIRSRLIFVLAIFSIVPVAVTSLFINYDQRQLRPGKSAGQLTGCLRFEEQPGQKLGQRFTSQPVLQASSQDIKDTSTTLLKLEPNSLIYANVIPERTG